MSSNKRTAAKTRAPETERSPGREAQRRRTRKAILEATAKLLGTQPEPSINDIAEAAEVSRRTVYLHFPTLDQLVLDATIGAMNTDVDEALTKVASDDARVRLRLLVEAIANNMAHSLPLGRRLIKLTVDAAVPGEGSPPLRGHRRIGWIEDALAPVRKQLRPKAFEELVSALAMIIGWEGYIVLTDIRGLDAQAAREVTVKTALVLFDAATKPSRSPG